ncbi:MAG: chromate transporter [Alphaproteobacteria bacterium]|nr:chromate transporter [Alphaproteobacteria bacterium]
MSKTAAPPSSAAPIPSHAELFFAFFKITIMGFGGTLMWTRRMFVERKRWMTAEEFNDVYALCQFLPGPNIVNLTAVFGSRMRGPTGAMAAWTGFLILPFCVMLAAGVLYERYGDVEIVRRVLSGVAPAAAGLLIATAAKMAAPMFRSFGPAPFVLLATAFAIGLMRWPLLLVLVVMAPLSIGLAWGMRPRTPS